jgi:outer membrane protein OmpA-like peptidoglycan-associated protein
MSIVKLTYQRFGVTLLLCVSTFVGLKLSAQVKNLSGEDSTIFVSNTVFVPKYAYQGSQENWDVDVADFNKDGFVDVISCSQIDNLVTINYNDGKGRFDKKATFPGGNFNRAVIALDANSDGWMDAAFVSIKDNRLHWAFNDQKGGLVNKKSVGTGLNPHDVQAADVNQDGFIDLIVVGNSDNSVHLHYGDGAGNFTGATAIPTGLRPRSVKIGDINMDGIPDLVVGVENREINYHLGEGSGKFKPKAYVLAGESVWGLAIVDVNKDSKPDIVGCSYSDNKLSVHISKGVYRGTLSFEPTVFVDSGDKMFDLVAADFDMDGDIDVVTASTRDELINVHLNDGTGKFSARKNIMSGMWNSGIAYADFDGDKDLDIVTSSIKDSKINIHRNKSIDPEGPLTATCIYGTVRDKDTQQPLQAIVALVGDDGLSVKSMKTNPDGTYRMCEVPFGKYTLDVKSKGYPKYSDPVTLAESLGKEGMKKDVDLEKIKSTFVFGRIGDEETKMPLPGAVIVIRDIKGATVATLTADQVGKYKTELPFGDNYEISVSFPEYNGKSGTFSLYPSNYPAGVEKNFDLLKKKPKTTAFVKGDVLDAKTKAKLDNATVTIMDKQGNTVAKVVTNAAGHYEAEVPFGSYDVTATRKGYMFKLDEFTIGPEHVETGLTKDIELIPFEVGMKIVLENIYYDVAKATLRPESVEELNRLIKIMNDNPTLVVEIGGHTDSDGSDQYNERLSAARAQSVVDYLIDAGITAERMQSKGYGEKEPIVPNDTPANKQLNRRTEFKVLAF